jgi:hypothetical protein
MKNLLLYVLLIILIYSILNLIPNNKLHNIDILLISIITVSICSGLNKYYNTKNEHFKESFGNLSNTSKIISDNRKLLETKLLTKPSETKLSETKKLETKPSETKKLETKPSETKKLETKPSETKKLETKLSETKQSDTKKLETKLSETNKLETKQLSSVTTVLKSNELEISFPFNLQFLTEVFNDYNNMKKNEKLEELIGSKIKKYSKKSEYYEILIQFIQTNMEQFYKYLTNNNFNKINEFIMDIKTRRNFNKDEITKDKSESRELSPLMKNYLKSMLKEGKYIDDFGFIKNMTDNDMKYSMYRHKDHEMLGTNDPTFTNKWNNDYVLLNTDKWRPTINHNMYKCKQEVKCQVCPSMTSGYPVKLKEFDMARKILPPDNINVDYINEKLLTGLS